MFQVLGVQKGYRVAVVAYSNHKEALKVFDDKNAKYYLYDADEDLHFSEITMINAAYHFSRIASKVGSEEPKPPKTSFTSTDEVFLWIREMQKEFASSARQTKGKSNEEEE